MAGYEDAVNGPLTVETILTSGVDVVCLQECNEGWEQLLMNALSETGTTGGDDDELRSVYPYTYFRHDQWTYGGRAVLSKYPLVGEPEWLPKVFPWWYGAMLVKVLVKPATRDGATDDGANGDGVVVPILNVHLRAPFPSNPFKVQRQRLFEIRTHLRLVEQLNSNGDSNDENTNMTDSHGGLPARLIILGDFNTRWGQCHQYLQNDRGFVSALSEQRQGWTVFDYTWHFKHVVTNLMDHIYFRPNEYRLTDCAIWKNKGGSDHFPLVANLQIL